MKDVPSSRYSMKNLDILLIDDDIAHQKGVLNSISKKPFKNGVFTYNDGKEALHQLDRKEKAMDQILVFMDIHTPFFNGWSFLDELQHKDYQYKVNVLIIASATSLSEKKKLNQYPQVIGYLEKQSSLKIILDVIDLFDNNLVISSQGSKTTLRWPKLLS